MRRRLLLMISILVLCAALGSAAQRDDEARKYGSGLAGAPVSARARVNPYEGKPEAVRAGRKLFERYCEECHGAGANRKAPALDSGKIEMAPPGDVFWIMTNGDLRAGMPSWSRLPEAQRWQIVSYIKTLQKLEAR
jgi:mono/diheme cytochrome c family protein